MKYLRKILLMAIPLWAAGVSLSGQAGADPQHRVQSDPFQSAFKKEGEILTKGSNEIPTGKLKVKSYRLERVKLDQPFVTSNGAQFGYIHKLVITLGAARITSTYTIWVDDLPFSATVGHDGSEIVAEFLNGPNLLEDGATLSVSEGMNPCSYKLGSETVLPEKLEVPPELRATPPQGVYIQLRTVSKRTINGKPVVNIKVKTDRFTADGRDAMPAIQIGKQSFNAGGFDHEVEADIPYDVFEQIPDNSQIFVKWGRCFRGGFVGRLNKSTLDH